MTSTLKQDIYNILAQTPKQRVSDGEIASVISDDRCATRLLVIMWG